DLVAAEAETDLVASGGSWAKSTRSPRIAPARKRARNKTACSGRFQRRDRESKPRSRIPADPFQSAPGGGPPSRIPSLSGSILGIKRALRQAALEPRTLA